MAPVDGMKSMCFQSADWIPTLATAGTGKDCKQTWVEGNGHRLDLDVGISNRWLRDIVDELGSLGLLNDDGFHIRERISGGAGRMFVVLVEQKRSFSIGNLRMGKFV